MNLFCNREDPENKAMICFGDSDDCFQEDAICILKAMRFAAVYDFVIDEKVSDAIHRNRHLLKNIAADRTRAELCRMLCGKGILDVLLNYSDVIATIIPEMEPCIGFDQNNRFHEYTVYDHIAHAVSNDDGDDIVVKMSLLLHDIGKPHCYTVNHKGGHFYGHGVLGRKLAEKVLSESDILELVLHHDAIITPDPETVRRWLEKIGEKQFERLLHIRMADISAHARGTQGLKIERETSLRRIPAKIIQKK